MRSQFQRVLKVTKAERGHRAACPFKDNLGPSCDCDGTSGSDDIDEHNRRQEFHKAFKLLGWTTESPAVYPWPSFRRVIGEHIIVVARVHSGWSHRWNRGIGWTITESDGFATPQACLNDLWEHIISAQDHSDEVIHENVRMKLEAAKARPATVLTSVPWAPPEE